MTELRWHRADEPPPEGVSVLAYLPGFIGDQIQILERRGEDWYDYVSCRVVAPSHWMELPAPPVADEPPQVKP